ncbi:MAG: 3-hydroxyacyl-ACP dehydratase FabZ [Lentisphaerae bacterium]|jgi:beta-hydroxyacyl-ACP dehydratase FabZ|nr:3-hydroxyacyl-ACP dehydratase FabZ [Lentisphaerota bacterium]
MESIYTTEDILKILPHRYPFLLVDRIVECNHEDWIVGIKNVTMNEPCFQGHFPGMPVFPGVLQLEALAQTSGVLLNKLMGRDGQLAFFMAVDKAKFRRLVVPGDQLRLEVKLLQMRQAAARMSGRVLVDGQVACQAEMLFGGR